MAVRMFKGTDDEAGTMAAVERVKDAQTKKGKTVGGAIGTVGGAIVGGIAGGPAGAVAGAQKGGKIGSSIAGALRGEKEDFANLGLAGAAEYLPDTWTGEDDKKKPKVKK